MFNLWQKFSLEALFMCGFEQLLQLLICNFLLEKDKSLLFEKDKAALTSFLQKLFCFILLPFSFYLGWTVHALHLRDVHSAAIDGCLIQLLAKTLAPIFTEECEKFLSYSSSESIINLDISKQKYATASS